MTTDIATNAAFCDGQGNCPTITTSNCNPFLCGATACLTSCSGSGANQCVAGAACIGGLCGICPTGQTACGSSCCGGSTPACVSGTCKECATSSDCTSRGYFTCSSNSCICRPQNGNNKLLMNAGFDNQLSGWLVQGSAGASSMDADNCPHSGSAGLLTTADKISQCVSAAGGATYNLGFRFKGALTGSKGWCQVQYYADPACIDAADVVGTEVATVTADTTAWALASKTTTTPDSTGSALIFCIGAQGIGYYDQIFFNDANSPTF